jgi:hypothetical protein
VSGLTVDLSSLWIEATEKTKQSKTPKITKLNVTRCWWLKPVVLHGRPRSGKLKFEARPRQIVCNTLS